MADAINENIKPTEIWTILFDQKTNFKLIWILSDLPYGILNINYNLSKVTWQRSELAEATRSKN